jgi:quercetin dioxygenase-like cupin family protein
MHPGIEVGYVLEGAIHFTFDGQAKVFNKGESFSIPLRRPHVATAGAEGVKLLNTFVVEKDQPLIIVLA